MNLNKLQLAGNLTHAPELRRTQSGHSVVEISIAINRKWRDRDSNDLRESTTFVNNITFWGKQAENLHTWVSKGDPIYLEGRLELDTWEDKETGKSRSKLKVIGDNWQFLKSKSNNNSDQSEDDEDDEEEHEESHPHNNTLHPQTLPDEPDDDTIPF